MYFYVHTNPRQSTADVTSAHTVPVRSWQEELLTRRLCCPVTRLASSNPRVSCVDPNSRSPYPQSNRGPEGLGYFEGEAQHETAYPGSQDSLPQPHSAFLHRRPFRRDRRRRPPLTGAPDITSICRRSTPVRDHTEG